MAEAEGNGDGVLTGEEVEDIIFPGGKGKLGDIQKDLSIMRQQGTAQARASSVLQRAMSPVGDDNFRELLLTGIDNKRLARLFPAAIEERKRYGVPVGPLVDRLHAESGRAISVRFANILRALTSSTYNINNKGMKGKFKNMFKGNRDDNSQINNEEE